MTRKQAAAASLTATFLVTAGIAAIEKYRLGHKLSAEERDQLNWLVKWLHAVENDPDSPEHRRLKRFWERLKDRGIIAPDRLAQLVARLRDDESPEDEVTDFLEGELSQIERQPDLGHHTYP